MENEFYTGDTMKILAELQQTEEKLRIQNEELVASNTELRQIQEQLEASRAKYTDLYDFAPVGYCAFDENGVILEANHINAPERPLIRLRGGYIVSQNLSIKFRHISSPILSPL